MKLSDDQNDWDEFEWEQALRESDEYAARYLQLLTRFCDLPGGNELIAQQMGPDFDAQIPECDFDCENCDQRWDCEFATTEDWDLNEEENDEEESEENDEEENDEEEDFQPEPGDSFFFERDPVFISLRQAAIGWCNIYAVILPSKQRVAALSVLYHVGRALSNLSYSIGDGLYEQPASNVAFAKRGNAHLNKAIGFINQIIKEKPRLKSLLDAVRKHLLGVREGMLHQLKLCREKASEK
jgi:hypothetical protein